MQDIAAVIAALDISHNPANVPLARNGALPVGVSFLIEIAAGEPNALNLASKETGRTERRLREAAGFFLEQVLLHPDCNCYRVLGGHSLTPTSELRRNMALMLRWLHPDVASHASGGDMIDRSVFAARVTQAWEHLKTEERRAEYDRTLKLTEARNDRSTSRIRKPELGLLRRRTKRPISKPAKIKPKGQRQGPKEDRITQFVRWVLGDR